MSGSRISVTFEFPELLPLWIVSKGVLPARIRK